MGIKKISRGPEINLEKCIENAGGNRFDLVLIAAAKAREIARKHKHDEVCGPVNAPVTALLEIEAAKIGKEYLRKV